MPSNTTRVDIADLRYLVGLAAAGQTNQQIADALTARGVNMPRWDGVGVRPATTTVAGLTVTVPSDNGYNLPGWQGHPGRWTAEAVAVVRASPEAVGGPDSLFLAARAKLGSDFVTTITVP